MAGFDEADLVITVGYDLVEHSPALWNPDRDRRIVCIDSVPAETDENFICEVELVGDPYATLSRLAEECRRTTPLGAGSRLREAVIGRLEVAGSDDAFPIRPPRALLEIRKLLGREDILVSDVGLHKLWIGRLWPAHEPNTVLIANGLAGMGFAVPAAIAAKLVRPEPQGRRRLRRRGLSDERAGARDREAARDRVRERDLGERPVRLDRLEAGQALRTPLRHRLREPRLRPLRRVVRAPGLALRIGRGLRPTARRRRSTLDQPSLIVVPVDYSPEIAIAEELGAETVRI